MPKLEPKQIQKELDQGILWPVYWIHGSERMKSRELVKRIRRVALGLTETESEAPRGGGMLDLSEELLDGAETDAASIVDAASSPSLMGGLRLIVVREAHAVKNPDEMAVLLGDKGTRDNLPSVCVFLSKDLDGRRKFSKLLVDKAAVVPCDEVLEADRPAWVGYLSKRKGLELQPDQTLTLSTLEPWTLDIVDQELEKLSLTRGDPGSPGSGDILLAGAESLGGADMFLEAFFARNRLEALRRVDAFARQPDEALPLLGLFSWNVRQLALACADPRGVKLSPYVAEKMQRWLRAWKLPEVIALQARLAELDFGTKQTPLLPVGLWGELVTEFCR